MFMNIIKHNKLVHDAVPTLFNFPTSASSSSLKERKRKAPTDRSSVVIKKSKDASSQASSTSPAAVMESSLQQAMTTSNTVGRDLSNVEALPQVDSQLVSDSHDAVPSSKRSTAAVNSAEMTPRKQLLSRKLSYAQACLSRARVALFRLRKAKPATVRKLETRSEAEVTPSCCPCTLCQEVNSLPVSQQQFIRSQIRACRFSKKGMRYSAQDKLLSLGLYYKSPSAYRFMSSSF